MKTKKMPKTKIDSPEDLLQRLDIIVVSSGPKEITAHCPFHSDRHPSFSMNARSGLWVCFSCQRKGTLESLIGEFGHGESAAEVLREIKYQKATQKKQDDPEEHLDRYMLEARYESFREPPRWAREDRQLKLRSVQTYGLRWDKGWIIPIHSPEEVFWGWQFKRMKFVSNYPSGIKKSQTLFGLQQVTSTTVVLVESPLDVVRLHSFGVSAVASFGAFVSRVQTRLLKDHAERIVLALDNDEAGWTQEDKLFVQLSRWLPTTCAEYPAKDPGELSAREIRRTFSDF